MMAFGRVMAGPAYGSPSAAKLCRRNPRLLLLQDHAVYNLAAAARPVGLYRQLWTISVPFWGLETKSPGTRSWAVPCRGVFENSTMVTLIAAIQAQACVRVAQLPKDLSDARSARPWPEPTPSSKAPRGEAPRDAWFLSGEGRRPEGDSRG